MTQLWQNGRAVSLSDVANPEFVQGTPTERAESQIENARRALVSLRASCTKWPELSAYADKVAPLVDRAEDYETRAEDAAANVALRRRERDVAARRAISEGEDPESAEKDASEALTVAERDAERYRRYYMDAAQMAAGEAAKGLRRLAELRKEAAPETLVETLRKLATAREEALRAVADAERRLRGVVSLVYGVRAVAAEAGDRDLARLAADPHFGYATRRHNSTDPTFEGALQVLAGMRDRLDFQSATSPIDLGMPLGAAVRYAVENADADAAEEAFRAEREAHNRSEQERGMNMPRPFLPRPAE